MRRLTKGNGMKFYLATSTVLLTAMLQFGFDWGKPVDKKNEVKQPAAVEKSLPTSMSAANNIPFPQMMGALSQNMTLWGTLPAENKTRAVEASVMIYRSRENSAILKPADFYVKQIDQSILANPSLQSTNLMGLLKILAVMEYDFYNGQNKDELAKETLGEKMYQSIRMRSGRR
ncbi:MAG TPA: hypothetical protein DIS66_08115 [Candidatus Omnitrophica bacterium]|nr:hypothetical protein [Candidatus Omnitrophota bacterium]